MEWHVVHQTNPMDNSCGTVVPRILGHAPSCFGRLHLLAPRGMRAVFAPEDSVTPVIVQGRDVGGLGTQRVVGDDALELRMILASRGHEACGGMACTIIFRWAVLLHKGFGQQRDHCTHGRLDNGGPSHVVSRRDRPVAVVLLQTRGTVNGLGGKRSRAIQGHHVVALQTRHRFKRLAALELPKDTLARRPERLGCNRIECRSHVRVARGTCDAVECLHMAFGPRFVTGEKRGGCERNHGERRHAGIRYGNARSVTAVIRDGGKAASNPAEERISGKMCACFGCHTAPSTPQDARIKSFNRFRERRIIAGMFTKSQRGYRHGYWVLSSTGNC